ncbi:hypothetical protein [Sedimentibacter sp. MB31-C6]|uniref:hypothetical protein n=1 Tax=Sedimentibacter sp. MB31-C6 TaxID=3109366 RepID=UPI002DDD6BAE|nr:hypothetical protein [Sedimentibacter sp. MB36-C1]WSI03716.1 hypothetical protein U8307_11735 [Sedimentibacter sp. MB36-C1]
MIDARKPYKVKNILISKLELNEVDDNNKITGFLDIGVFSDNNSIPINNAKVSIYLYSVRGIYNEAAEENLIVSYTTDENGKVPPIELPVIHEFGNEEENRDEYHMRVEAIGYYPIVVINMEIFPNITTTFNVKLTPIVTGEPYTEYIIIPEKH